MKKLFIILLSIFLLTQNNDYNELNDLAIVNSIVFDYQDNNYNIYIQIQNPTSNNYIIYNTTKNTIKNSFNSMSKKSPNKLYYKHLNTIFITENSLSKYNEIANYFINNNTTRNEFYIFIISNNNIKELINKQTTDINNLIKTNNYQKPTFDNILNNYLDNKNTLTIPKLSYIKNSYNLSKLKIPKEKLHE